MWVCKPVQGGVLRRGWWCHRAGRALVAAVPCWRFGPVWGTCVGLASAGSCPGGNLEAGSCCSSKSQTLQATPPRPALTSSCQPKALFSRAFAPNHPSRRAAGRDASPSCSQGGERHIKLLEKQNNPSVKVTLTNFVVCTNWQANYWAIYCFSCTEGGNIYLLYKQIVHSCFEVSCMIDGAVHRNHKV